MPTDPSTTPWSLRGAASAWWARMRGTPAAVPPAGGPPPAGGNEEVQARAGVSPPLSEALFLRQGGQGLAPGSPEHATVDIGPVDFERVEVHPTRGDGEPLRLVIHETRPRVRWHLPPPQSIQATVRDAAVHTPAFAVTEPISNEASARNARRWGWGVAVRDAVSQAVGRFCGLAMAARMMTDAGSDEDAQARVVRDGIIIITAMGLTLGARAAYLMTRAWRGEGSHPGTTLAVGLAPWATQLSLVLLATQLGNITAGMTVAMTIAGRLVSAGLRDTVSQSQASLWGQLDPVEMDGRNLDPIADIDRKAAFDRDRLSGAFSTYLLSSLALLWLGRMVLESGLQAWIDAPEPGEPTTYGDRIRAGAPAIFMSILNEAFDAFQHSWWQAEAARGNGIALRYTPGLVARLGQARGRPAGTERKAEADGHPAAASTPVSVPATGRTKTGNTCAAAGRSAMNVAERAISHGGMRQVFGTVTADICTTLAALPGNTLVTRQVLIATAAMLNAGTTFRGFTTELGRKPSPRKIREEIESQRHLLDTKRERIAALPDEGIQRRYPELFEEARAEVERVFRHLLVAHAQHPLEPHEVELVVNDAQYQPALWREVADKVRQFKLAQIDNQRERPLHWTTWGDGTFGLEADSERNPSAGSSPASSPAAQKRRADGKTAASSVNPERQRHRGETVLLHNIGGGTADGFLQNLRRGDPILVDQRPVTFLYWISRTAERKAHPSSTHPGVMVVASADSITAPGWPPPEARDGQFVYRIDPAAPTPLLVSPRVPPPPVVTSEPAVDGAAGLGLPRQAGEPRR